MDPKSDEVTRELKSGQTPYDRPDILCRLFKIKLDNLIKDIVKDGIFGKSKAHVHVIEFQKRGAPHAHILIWIENFDQSPENIDNTISAEIPHPNSSLHETVKKFMIHGPCGNINKNLGFMKSGSCSREFPKSFADTTTVNDSCFPDYRRRSPTNGGHTARKFVRGTEITIDNQWVIPYSPYLLHKYQCHINVEYCHTVTSVKYLFLYHFKGEDRITVEGLEPNDEIQKFSTQRYLSSCYSYWRLIEFEQVKMKPNVYQLPVHLENQQTVIYNPNEADARNTISNNCTTQLIEFFNTNERFKIYN